MKEIIPGSIRAGSGRTGYVVTNGRYVKACEILWEEGEAVVIRFGDGSVCRISARRFCTCREEAEKQLSPLTAKTEKEMIRRKPADEKERRRLYGPYAFAH